MRAALTTALLLIAASLRAEAPPGQAEFEAATAREGRGDYQGAAAALEQLGRTRPDDSFADDALFEAAVIAEEHLADPARAARLYEEVATRYPSSRLSRRARARADFLGTSLKTGEAPLREYLDILNNFSKHPKPESIARMETVLREHPDFALADRTLYWLGAADLEQHRERGAVDRFLELERRFPRNEWAGRAKKARGDLALRTGHPFQAHAIFVELSQAGDLLARAAAEEGLASVRSAERRFVLLVLSILYFLGFLLLHLAALRKVRPIHLPTEVLFYAPVALLFILAAFTENGAIAVATSAIAVGGLLIVWATTALNAARLTRGALSIGARLARAAAILGAVLSIGYIAIQTTGLTDLVIETLRSGPER